MIPAPTPPNEAERLAALRRYVVLDTPPELELDDLTHLAAAICQVPVALISLVDVRRQWFKSRVGLDTTETPREYAFCGHAIQSQEVFEIEDATQDERFHDNPLVVDDPHICFYAGAPLRTPDGYNLGALCVIDRVPRRLSPAQRDALMRLSRQVIAHFELRRSTRQLTAISALHDAILNQDACGCIVATDLAGTVTLINTAAQALLGYAADEVVGRCTPDRLHDPAELADWARQLSREVDRPVTPGVGVLLEAARRPRQEPRELKWVRKDGIRVPVQFTFKAVRDAQGRLQGYVAAAQDLTRWKFHETLVRQQQQAMDSAMDGIAVLDAAGVFLYLNRAHATLFGYDAPSQLIGLSWRSLYSPPEVRRIEEEIIPRVVSDGRWQGHTIARRRDGTEFHESLSLTLVHGVGLISVCRDNSEWKRAEDQLRMSEQRQELALAGADLGLWDWRVQTGDVVFDARWCGMLGYQLHELAPRVESWLALLNPEDRPAVQAILEPHLQGATPGYEAQFRLRHKEGHWVWILARGKVVERNAAGAPLRMTGTHMDITARRENERALVAAKDAAEAANRAKSDFLAMMSHEIRTPLNGVLGFTDVLLDSPLAPEQQGFARTIKHSGETLLTIIDDILDFSKVEAGKLTIERIAFDLPENLREIILLFGPRAAEKHVTLSFDYPPGIPRELILDPIRVRQLLLNLVGNAVRFTPAHGAIRVYATHDLQQGCIQISVADTGIGIAKEKQALLFNKFVQADSSTTRRYGGTGLGLAISKRLTELMGGKIGFESEEGRGSTFWFTLPLPDPAALRALTSPSPTPENRPPSVPATQHLRDRRILVAEDIVANQLLIRRLLEKYGCHVTVATNGAEALDRFRDESFDLILMDCHMPILDGFQAAETIRRTGASNPSAPRIPIIAVTADAMVGDRERCLQAGMDDYITKPIRIPTLEAILVKWLPAIPTASASATRSAA